MRKPLVAAAAAALLIILSACGASGGESDASDSPETTEKKATTTTEPESDAMPVDEWAEGFCASFSEWTVTIQETGTSLGEDLEPGDMEGARTAIVDLFDQVSAQTQDLIDTLDEGYPDIDDGDQFVADLQGKFEGFVEATEASKEAAAEIPVDDSATFQTEFTAVFDEFQTNIEEVGDSFGELDTKYPDEDLQSALQESCDI